MGGVSYFRKAEKILNLYVTSEVVLTLAFENKNDSGSD